jgi:hypothetical protein
MKNTQGKQKEQQLKTIINPKTHIEESVSNKM